MEQHEQQQQAEEEQAGVVLVSRPKIWQDKTGRLLWNQLQRVTFLVWYVCYQRQGFRKIEELENYSVAKTDIMKLKLGGFHTLESVSYLLNL